ncbi:hypothetical protein L195_g011025 [Trifolium pratense]|uniref:DUF4283 domain-containing protein n=1 Tax=Trifolium pratense TaxID=57577 RepID=A0A2K3PGH4_TRIPR|nr:hypothetical protein L195_g011025 [Trifolium pratense]
MAFPFQTSSRQPTSPVQDKETERHTLMMSFRDKVLDGTKVPVMCEKVDLLAQKLVRIEHAYDHGGAAGEFFPMLHVDTKVIDELSVPWKDVLVVKIIGKELTFDIMKNQLENVWNLAGKFDLMDIENGFYMVKFDREEGKTKVINGVPWKLLDHYLTVCRFTSTINTTGTSVTNKTMVWVRISGLHLVYYDENFLLAVASAIGNPVKVDLHALWVEFGRFARVCVEIDLDKPVVKKVGINGELYRIHYEDSHINAICTECGSYYHVRKYCPSLYVEYTIPTIRSRD